MKKLFAFAATTVLAFSLLACSENGTSSSRTAFVSDIGFNDIDKVLVEVADSETVVFLLRHAERGEDYSRAGLLTENGIEQSKSVGAKLRTDEEFFYASSDYGRTQQTCDGIAEGRGEKNYQRETWNILAGEWYEKDVALNIEKNWHNWETFSEMAYEGGFSQGYYDLASRSEEWLDSLTARLPSMKRVNILISHDFLVAGMTIYGANWQIDLRQWMNGKWINYLAGIAIIIDPSGNRRFITVRGLETGRLQ